jgi:protoporphyrinogen oxidase
LKVVILGGGPAGLTAGRLLIDRGVPCRVLERDVQVGGLSKTVERAGYRFDVGGHRFFTKNQWVERFWKETLDSELRRVPRLSRIYYRNLFFHYPLQPWNAVRNLGFISGLGVAASWMRAKCFPLAKEDSFEACITNRFGRRLYEVFFKSYTEKVWGIPGSEIRAEWAMQRIKGLSLGSAVSQAFGLSRKQVKSLIDSFDYPRYGPGMMWDAVRHSIEGAGQQVSTQAEVISLLHDGAVINKAVIADGDAGGETVPGTHFLSSIPLADLVQLLQPAAPTYVLQAARRLRYRSFIAVNLILNKTAVFPDSWIYVHMPQVGVARIQNYKNWSQDMVPDPSTTALGLEYFCFPDDELWNRSAEDLIQMAGRELELLKLASSEDVLGGFVHRERHAYPVYDRDYQHAVSVIRQYLAGFSNLQAIGRNGLHKYNNQDHSMLCARFAVENLFGARQDLWAVNSDNEYQETVAPPPRSVAQLEC